MLVQKPLNKRFTSKNGWDIVDRPNQYFNSYSLTTGRITYKGTTYSLKKIEIDEDSNIFDIPEVKLIDSNSKCPYLLNYVDYVIEQHEINDTYQDKVVYIIMENSDYDLRSYVSKYGQLPLEDVLALCECLIGANYFLQKHVQIPHEGINPVCVQVILSQKGKQNRPIFKLSHFVPLSTTECTKKHSLPYMAPEVLCSSVTSRMHGLQGSSLYNPSQELQTLINECPDEIRYDPFRADVFSVGLTIFSAATNIFFGLTLWSNTFEAARDGQKDIFLVNQNLKLLKNQYQCDSLVELLRIMLTHNPLVRYDFEELALRIDRLNARDSRIPKVITTEDGRDGNLEEEHKVLKGKYLELEKSAVRMREREVEYQNVINHLKELLDGETATAGINTRKTLDIEEHPIEIFNEMSSIASILEENTSFLSPTHRKTSKNTPLEEKFERSGTRALTSTSTSTTKQIEAQLVKDARELLGPKRQMSATELHEQQKMARNKNLKMNQGQLTHLEIKNSIIKRREEVSDTRVVSCWKDREKSRGF